MTRDLYRPDPNAQAKVLEALAAGHARGRREAELTRAAPDRAAALRDVKTLLRRVDWAERMGAENELRLYTRADSDEVAMPVAVEDFAALIVDRVLGAEQDGDQP